MACRAVEIWTSISLIGAYLDLALASLFLVGATIAFLVSKFLSIFGLSLPCSCHGHFGHAACTQSNLLIDFPTSKLAGVRRSIISRFPYDSILSSGDPSSRICRYSDRIQSKDDGSSPMAVLACRSRSRSLPTPTSSHNRCVRRSRLGDSIMDLAEFQSASRDRVSGGLWITEEKNLADETPNGEKNSTNGVERGSDCYEEERIHTTRSPEKEFEDERDALLSLYAELEKERSAAATATDEAMSMISRLQNEKAEIQMKARHYQRMSEEKSAYDEEEMEILKEILVTREFEKHALEKELEMYKRSLEDSRTMLHGDNAAILPHECKQTETEPSVRDDHIASNGELEASPASYQKSCSETAKKIGLMRDFRRRSLPSVGSEAFEVENDVGYLQSRLKIIREGREKLSSSAGHGERETFRLQLFEENARLRSEIKSSSEPHGNFRRASLSSLTKTSFDALLESTLTTE